MLSIPVIFLVVSARLHHQTPTLKVGDKVPETSLSSLQGAVFHFPRHLNKPVIINFFATWCPPCQSEAPNLANFAKTYAKQIQLIMVDRREGPPLVRQFINTYHLQGTTTLLDQNNQWATLFGVTGQPETIGIDTNGVIRFHQLGPETASQLDDDLTLLLHSH